MKNDTYLNDVIFDNQEGNLKRLPKEFAYRKIILDNYKVFDRNSPELIIWAIYDSKFTIKDFESIVTCKKPDILMSLLTLKKNLSPELFDNIKSKIFWEKNVTDKDIELIIRWCKKNGYPFAPDKETHYKNQSKNRNMLQKGHSEMQTDCVRVKLEIYNFIKRLNDIYSLFLIYQSLLGFEPDFDTATISYNENNLEKFVALKDISKGEYKAILENKYQKISLISKISVNNGVHIETMVNDLFDAAFYQLAMLMDEPNKEIRICPLCNQYFEIEDPRQKYCHNKNKNGKKTCYPQKMYKRNRESKKVNIN